MNVGEVRNKGWELSLSWNDRINDFGYSISGNLSDNRNEVVDLGRYRSVERIQHLYGSRITV